MFVSLIPCWRRIVSLSETFIPASFLISKRGLKASVFIKAKIILLELKGRRDRNHALASSRSRCANVGHDFGEADIIAALILRLFVEDMSVAYRCPVSVFTSQKNER